MGGVIMLLCDFNSQYRVLKKYDLQSAVFYARLAQNAVAIYKHEMCVSTCGNEFKIVLIF